MAANDRLLTRRTALLGGAALGLGAASLRSSGAHAQDATPCGDGGGVALGTAVPFTSVEGVELGTVSVDAVTDPFTGYNPSYPPPRGNRFLLLQVTAKNTGTTPWQVDGGRVFLQDTEGFVIYPAGVDLGPEPPVPAFGGPTLDPGATATGVIGYVLVKGVAPKRVFFTPSSDRLLLLAELPG